MDVKKLKEYSDLSFDIAVAKRNALEKAHSRLVVAYREHLFKADVNTICLVSTLKKSSDKFIVLDTNDNPVEIDDPEEFLSVLVSRNQESLNAYNQLYKTFAKKGT